ncbi:MAG: glutathione S-transferase family protein [Myxococcales bacterium]|nr:glutathione S-transferase family protein [Myxococcales bacterium]
MATLYHYMDCPYCFKVRAYLNEREIPYDQAVIERGSPPPEMSALNPLRRLPVWVTDDNKPVFGSNTIIDYLEVVEPDGLLPEEPLHRARCWMADELARDGLLEPLIAIDRSMAGREPGDWDIVVYRKKVRRVQRTLEVFGALLGGREWLVGDDLSVADLAIALPLTIVERYGVDLDDKPALKALRDRLNARYSIVEARKRPGAGPEG